jgi:decaprenylphospho-beta-D-erythro-pentofuranosid-2-ulose 2-reductase
MKRNILILGATSSIGRATAMAFAEKGDNVYLAGRDKEELERNTADIYIRYGIQTYSGEFDIEKTEQHQTFFQKVLETVPQIDGIVFVIGTMDASPSRILHINLTSAVLTLEICAKYLEEKKSGFIIGISSCAGDRGRQSNYLYGAAKGGLSIYLQGLRNRLSLDL